MRLTPYHYAFCSALTLAACSDDAPLPGGNGGSNAGGSAGTSTAGTQSAGSSSAGTSSGGSSAGTATAGTSSTAGKGGSGGGGAGGSAGSGGSGGNAPEPECGNGKKEGTEACDDGGKAANDGCSATCTVDDGYACPTEGPSSCKPVCGDGKLIAPEACDDKNAGAGDGCNAKCELEDGFDCKTVGEACTSVCGDGILVGDELCDDKNSATAGCSATCTPEAGYVCDIPGSSCRKKPDCTGGLCTSTCGDGLVIGEACDDGNVAAADGCSATCTVEATHTCETVPVALPAQLAIPVTYRDFVSVPAGGSTKFADQQAFQGQGITLGMVTAALGVDGLPVYSGVCEQDGPNAADKVKCPYGAQSTSKANFDMWYRNTDTVNLAFPGVVRLDRVGDGVTGVYVFDGGQTFTPLTGKGWDKQGKEGLAAGKNFGFTTELRYFFTYVGDETLEFSGDDDVWVFINGKLAVDIGGLHPKQTKSVTLNVQKSAELGLMQNKVYELSLFHAERAPAESNFKLTMTGFVNNTSKCTAK